MNHMSLSGTPELAILRAWSFAAVAYASAVCWLPTSIYGDHPSYPITVDLGPGNEDFEEQLQDYDDSFSRLRASLARLRGYDLSGRDLRRAEIHLHEFELQGINFDGANLTAANLAETSFDHCSFRNAILRRVYLSGAAYIRPTCDLAGADISGSAIWLTKEQLISTKNYQEKRLESTVISGDLSGISFAGFDLSGAIFTRCNLEGADFTGADISGCTVQITKGQILTTESYREKNLDGTVFVDCDFRDVDFSRFDLGYFVGCDLRGADLTDASFSMSPLPVLQEFPADRYGFSTCRLSAEQFYSTRTYKSGDPPFGFGFVGMNLDGWDFSGMDLRGVGFPQCSLDDASFEGARGGNFRNAIGLSVKQVRSMWNYGQDMLDEYGLVLLDYILEELQAEKEATKE